MPRCLKAPPNLGGVGEVIRLIRGSDKKTQPYRLGGEWVWLRGERELKS